MKSHRQMVNMSIDQISINNLKTIDLKETELPYKVFPLKGKTDIEYIPQDSKGKWKGVNLVGNFNPFSISKIQDVVAFLSQYSDQYVITKEGASSADHIHFWMSNINKPLATVKSQLRRKFPELVRKGKGGANKWKIDYVNDIFQIDYIFKELTKDNYLTNLFSNVFGYTGIWKTVEFHQNRYIKEKSKRDQGQDSKFLAYCFKVLPDNKLKDIPAIVSAYADHAVISKLKRVNK